MNWSLARHCFVPMSTGIWAVWPFRLAHHHMAQSQHDRAASCSHGWQSVTSDLHLEGHTMPTPSSPTLTFSQASKEINGGCGTCQPFSAHYILRPQLWRAITGQKWHWVMRHHQLLLGPCTLPHTPTHQAQPPLFIIIFYLFWGCDCTSSKAECVPLEFYRMPSPLHINVSTYISSLLLLQLYWSLSSCSKWTSTYRLRCNLSPYLDVIWLWSGPKVFYRFASTSEFAKYLAKVSRQRWASVSFTYGSFRIRKPECSGETTCPATSDTAHSVHKTSRGGKSPLFFLPGDNSYKKKHKADAFRPLFP